ncbi:MAG TPA: AgmX/PglI C-terminal domain-containing protein [Kofleriaceae bacterium]|jgi:hypothetical protein
MVKIVFPMLLVLGACHHKQADTSDDTGPSPTIPDREPEPADESSRMIPPEQMDQVQRALDRKRDIVSHCLGTAIDDKELPKNSHGKMVLEIVIAPGGNLQSVKVISSTLDSKSLTDCVIGHVKTADFPKALQHRYETSYTYAFEAM